MIRAGRPSDHDFIRSLAVEVFSYLGDYARILPPWLEHEGVSVSVVEQHGRPVGFTMVGFHCIDAREGIFAAELLAIAVAPEAQRGGNGRKLLEQAIALARAARRRLDLREMRLSVADANLRARRMFTAAGFEELPGDHGSYEHGQRALHLRLAL